MELEKAKKLAIELMIKHNLHYWEFKFDSAKRRFGCCFYEEKLITLSKHLVLLNSEEEVKDTILHEIAHALTPGQHHNKIWRQKAIEIGCSGTRCYSSENTVTVKGNYIVECPSCKHKENKFRKPKYRVSCGKCSGDHYNPKFDLIYTRLK